MPDPAPAAPKKRGPNTPEGKARSSMNALKHGLRAKRFSLLPEEDLAEFSSFAADIRAAYRPADAVEAQQVEGIVVAMWREIRADRIEGEEMGRNAPAAAGLSHGTDLAHAHDRASLTTALRYRTQAQMELKRATDLFWRHRKARLAGLLEEGRRRRLSPRSRLLNSARTNSPTRTPRPPLPRSPLRPRPLSARTNSRHPPRRRPRSLGATPSRCSRPIGR